MKKKILLLFFLAFTLVLIKCSSKKEQPLQSSWDGYQPFPSGYDYMDTTRLQRALANVYIDTIRQHGWSLFAGIMQPAANNIGWPTWYTWPNSYDAMQIKQIFELQATLNGNSNGKNVLSLIGQSKLNLSSIPDSLLTPGYPIPSEVKKMFPGPGIFKDGNIIPGKHFLSNGDIMIPTESISLEGYNWIQGNRYYNSGVMDSLYKQKVPNLNAPSTYIVTKHMYWPVLASQPLSAIPLWQDAYLDPSYKGYAGYEQWPHLVAVDPTNTRAGQKADVSYLYGVHQAIDTSKFIGPKSDANAMIHNLNEFYYHQVTQADWDSFDNNDKAILNASSYWAYNKPFGVGDYLVTIAMHINTKELPSWTMQSVWWSDQQDSSPYSKDRPNLPNAVGPWAHYNLVQAYGVPVVNDALPVAMNPYIELVIHPIATNCNNCHMRAGYPKAFFDPTNGQKVDSVNWAGYQNAGCPDLLQKLLPTTSCLTKYTRTDFQWIISDYTHPIVLPPTKK